MPEGFKLLDAYVEVTASGKGVADKVAGDIQRESGGRLDRTGEGMGGHLLGGLRSTLGTGAIAGLIGGVTSSITSGMFRAVGAGVTLASDAITGFVGTGVQEMLDAATGVGQLQAAIKSTGGVANVSVAHMEDLASSIQAMSGQTDDSIVSAGQLLLTFTNIRNTKTDKIFDATTRAAADMAARLGGDASGSAIQLGKALNDPVKGVTALQRVGVSFTKDQKALIKSLVSTGDTVGAQKVILKELNTEFGGSAKAAGQTLPGQLNRLKRGFEDVTQMVLTKVSPAFKPLFKGIESGAKSVSKYLNSKEFQKGLDKFSKDFGEGLKGVGEDLKKAAPDLKKAGKALLDSGPTIVKALRIGVRIADGIAKTLDWFDKTEPGLNKWFDTAHKTLTGTDKDTARSVKKWDALEKSIDNWFDKSHDHLVDYGRRAGSVLAGTDKDTQSSIAAWNKLEKSIDAWFDSTHDNLVSFASGVVGTFGRIGGQMVDGLIGGLRDAWSGLTSTIHDLAMQLPEPIRKALDIHSPSKVFHLIGQQVGQGLHRGLLGSVDQIKTASQKMVDAIGVDKHFKGTTLGAKMTAAIKREARLLEDLSRARETATGRLADARSHLADVISGRKDFAANVKAGVLGNADAASLFMASPTVMAAQAGTLNGQAYQPSWTTTAHTGLAAVKTSLKKLLADTRKFSSNLARLAKMGVDPYTYDELVQAGVRGGGLETSDALIKDPKLAGSIFTLERQVATAGRNLGNRAATHEYAGQVASARAAVHRAERAVDRIEVTMVVEARKIDEVAKLVRMVEHVKQTARKRKGKH